MRSGIQEQVRVPRWKTTFLSFVAVLALITAHDHSRLLSHDPILAVNDRLGVADHSCFVEHDVWQQRGEDRRARVGP